MLQIDRDLLTIDGVEGGTGYLFHGIAAQGEWLGHCEPPMIALYGIHQTVGLVVNLEHSAFQCGACGEPVDGVVVSRFLPDLDLTGDGGVLPCNLGRLTGTQVHGLQSGIENIALCLQLTQIDLSGDAQIIHIGVTALIGSHLIDGVMVAVIDDEADVGDARAVDTADLMNDEAGDGIVFHPDDLMAAVGDGEIVALGIEAEPLGSLCLQTVVAAILQSKESTSGLPRRDRVDQCIVTGASDLEGRIGDPGCVVLRADLDDLDASNRLVVEVKCLRVVTGIDDHGLRGIFSNGESRDT